MLPEEGARNHIPWGGAGRLFERVVAGDVAPAKQRKVPHKEEESDSNSDSNSGSSQVDVRKPPAKEDATGDPLIVTSQ